MLEVSEVSVRYGETVAVDRVSFTVPDGTIVAVLGPSGSGKTSLLRAVAGLESITGGSVSWDGHDLTAVAPHRRDFGLMFQDHALFGHRDVGGNVAFGLRMHGQTRETQTARVTEMLTLVGLAGFEHRRVDELSGGERQRVALARALAPRPCLLMLDEPLASVDRERREYLALEIQRIIRTSGTPALLVTHDLDEAFTLADAVVILDHGRVTRADSAREVWRSPGSVAVARFLGVTTGWELAVEDGMAMTPWGAIPVPPTVGARAWVGFRASALRVGPETVGPHQVIEGTVRASRFQRDQFLVELDTPVGIVTAIGSMGLPAGARALMTADLDAAVVVPA